MATIGVPLSIGQLPYQCYPSDPQTLYADMFNRARALYPAITGVVISASPPPAADSDKLWIKTSGGAPVGQFIRYNAEWVWPHEAPASGNERRLWVGTLVGLDTYDGGTAGAVGAATGPFWAEDAAFRDRIPIGVGPSLATVVATNYGDADGLVSIGNSNLPETRLLMFANEDAGGGTGDPTAITRCCVKATSLGGDNDYGIQRTAAASTEATLGQTSAFGQPTPAGLNVLNPVRALYIIQRTARIYRVG